MHSFNRDKYGYSSRGLKESLERVRKSSRLHPHIWYSYSHKVPVPLVTFHTLPDFNPYNHLAHEMPVSSPTPLHRGAGFEAAPSVAVGGGYEYLWGISTSRSKGNLQFSHAMSPKSSLLPQTLTMGWQGGNPTRQCVCVCVCACVCRVCVCVVARGKRGTERITCPIFQFFKRKLPLLPMFHAAAQTLTQTT